MRGRRGGRKDGEEGAGRKGSGRGKLEKGVHNVFFSVLTESVQEKVLS